MSVIVPVKLIAIAPRGRPRGQLEVIGRAMCVIRPGRFGVTRGPNWPVPEHRDIGWFTGHAEDMRSRAAIPTWVRRQIPRDQPDLHYLAVHAEDDRSHREGEWWLFSGTPAQIRRADAALAGEVTAVIHDPKATKSSPVSPHSLLVAAGILAAVGVILEILALR